MYQQSIRSMIKIYISNYSIVIWNKMYKAKSIQYHNQNCCKQQFASEIIQIWFKIQINVMSIRKKTQMCILNFIEFSLKAYLQNCISIILSVQYLIFLQYISCMQFQQTLESRLANLKRNNIGSANNRSGIRQNQMIQIPLSSRSRSKIWLHSHKLIINNKKLAKCNYCGFKLQMRNTATNFMRRHLQKQHSIQLTETIIPFAVDKPVEEMIAKLASINLMPYRQIAEMQVIEKHLKNQATPSIISEIVKKVYQRKRLHVRQLVSKRFGQKFTLSVDCCQIQSRNFWNIFVYNQKGFYQLPMVRERQHETNQNLKRLILESFQSMCIQPQQINQFIMNTNSKLSSVARDLGWSSQRCLVHMLYTAVEKIVFGYRVKDKNLDSCSVDNEIFQSEDQQNDQRLIYDDCEVIQRNKFPNQQRDISRKRQNQSTETLIDKCRQIVSLIKRYRSQQNISVIEKQSYGRLYLVIDQNKRWPMTYLMIKYFLIQLAEINKFLLSYSPKILVSQKEKIQLCFLKKLLEQPFKIIRHIQGQQCNIIEADISLNNLILCLSQQNSHLSQRLHQELLQAYSKLRNYEIICSGTFLMSQKYYKKYKRMCLFKTLDEKQILSFIHAKFSESQEESLEESLQHLYQPNLFDQMYQQLYHRPLNFTTSLKSDLKNFISNGIKSQKLSKIENTLKKIPYVSIQSRRYFIPFSQQIDSYRGKLSDDSIIGLNYMNWYFKILKREIL